MKRFLLLFCFFALATYTPSAHALVTNPSPASTTRPLKTRLQDLQESLKNKLTQDEETFKTKLATIKDEKLRTVAQNTQSTLSVINTNQTTKMTENLSRLSEILSALSSKSAALKATGVETKTLEAKIALAQSSLKRSESAILTQSSKSYLIPITLESRLKANILYTVSQFKTDIKALYQSVKSTHQATREAALELQQLNSTGHNSSESAKSKM